MKIKSTIKQILPKAFRIMLSNLIDKKGNERRERMQKIVDYFRNLNKIDQSSEILDIISFFEKNEFSYFPYDFFLNHTLQNEVFFDDGCKMYFVLHKNKKMYFPKTFDKKQSECCYSGLMLEQNEKSPHLYTTDKFCVQNGDVIADIGAAEGIFSLDNVEKASKIYLFECDKNWIEALEKTMEPYKTKVQIINKFISNQTKGNSITLDDFLQENRIDFIKADIEGAEIDLLKGAKKTMQKNKNLRMVLCTYHRENDAKILEEILKQSGFSVEFGTGYMIFIDDENLKEPYLRKAVIRAWLN
jgi:hypothetical protein